MIEISQFFTNQIERAGGRKLTTRTSRAHAFFPARTTTRIRGRPGRPSRTTTWSWSPCQHQNVVLERLPGPQRGPGAPSRTTKRGPGPRFVVLETSPWRAPSRTTTRPCAHLPGPQTVVLDHGSCSWKLPGFRPETAGFPAGNCRISGGSGAFALDCLGFHGSRGFGLLLIMLLLLLLLLLLIMLLRLLLLRLKLRGSSFELKRLGSSPHGSREKWKLCSASVGGGPFRSCLRRSADFQVHS